MAEVKITAASGGGSAGIAGPPSSSANTVLKLPADTGSAGQVLKVKSANHSATNAELEWAADSGGKILGVNSVTYDNQQRTVSSTSWVDSGMEVTYTPVASNSTALISLFAMARAASSQYLYLQLRQADEVWAGGSAGGDEYISTVIGHTITWIDISGTWHVSPTWTAGTQTSFQIYMMKHTSSQGDAYLGWGDPGTSGNYKDGLIIQEVAA